MCKKRPVKDIYILYCVIKIHFGYCWKKRDGPVAQDTWSESKSTSERCDHAYPESACSSLLQERSEQIVGWMTDWLDTRAARQWCRIRWTIGCMSLLGEAAIHPLPNSRNAHTHSCAVADGKFTALVGTPITFKVADNCTHWLSGQCKRKWRKNCLSVLPIGRITI